MSNAREKHHRSGARPWFVVLGAVFAWAGSTGLPAADIIRGPYLQRATPTNMVVRWRTDVPTQAWVAYGTSPVQLDNVLSGTNLFTDHGVVMKGLQPSTKYYYAVGEPGKIHRWGPEYTFSTPPEPGTPGRYRIWVIGDSGTASAGFLGSHWVRDAYYAEGGLENTDVWLMLGDNAYTTGTDQEYQVAVFDTYPDLLRRVPVWSTIGNHETYSADTNGIFAYLKIFSPPINGEAGGMASGTPRYYSFDHGNVHFVCLDSETSRKDAASPMMTWLHMDLQQNTNQWLIAFWHTPPYSKGSHDSDVEGRLITMRTNVVPVLESYGVDLVLTGHSHNYERSYLLNGHYGFSGSLTESMILNHGSGRVDDTGPYFKPGPAGTVYVVAGSSGWATFTTGRHPAMHVQHLQIGSLVLDVEGGRLDGRFLRDNGENNDHFTIIKEAPDQTFRVVHFRLEDEQEVLWWNAQTGRSYVVERTPELSPADWQPVSGEIVAVRDIASWTNAATATGPQGYFRVREE